MNREVFLIPEDEITRVSLKNFITDLRELEDGKGPIVLHLSSIGGDRIVAAAIYDIIKQSKFPFIIIGYGAVASSASIILQASKEKGYRILMPSCCLLIHEGLVSLENNPKSAISHIEENNRLVNNMYDIYAEACQSGEFFHGEKISKIKGYIKRKLSIKEDWTLDAKESIYYGFADAILGSKDFETVDKIRSYL